MNVLIIGAGGMIGRKLTQRIKGQYDLDLVDVVSGPGIREADLSVPGAAETLVKDKPDIIVHLAAIVSGEAEADFERGYRINLDGTRYLFEAIRKTPGYKPRVVFTSSIAVFGAPFPEKIGDEYFTTPLTSYGTQKAICELLLSDYTRKGFFDGIGIRLPTICVRPGTPNKAASGFFSNILREPLAGKEAVLPVDDSVRHWHASPRTAVDFLVKAMTMDLSILGARRILTMPGLSATVAEQIEALRRVAGDKAVALIKRQPDATIQKIVAGWPQNFNAKRAIDLGFKAESTFDDIIRVHLEDEKV